MKSCRLNKTVKHYYEGKLYHVWKAMRMRCKGNVSSVHTGYDNVSICEEWNDYHVFEEYAITHDYEEGCVIHRKDNDGDYEPSNVEFMSKSDHATLHSTGRKRS